VQYRYDGKQYWTQTDRDPGDRIKVRVSVQPVVDSYRGTAHSGSSRSNYDYNES